MALLAGMAFAAGATGGDVHLGKPAGGVATAPWHGLTVGEVLDPAQVQRIIVLRAVTSAPRELDLANLRRMLADSAHLPLRPPSMAAAPPWRTRDGIWHAVVLMQSGQVFELDVHAGEAGLRACLAAGDGARGCFEPPPAA